MLRPIACGFSVIVPVRGENDDERERAKTDGDCRASPFRICFA